VDGFLPLTVSFDSSKGLDCGTDFYVFLCALLQVKSDIVFESSDQKN
jgi:hypothetical protein